METTTRYPVGGPREPVYALMRGLGFSVANWTDKVWNSADGIEVSIFGTGSMARLSLSGEPKGECALDRYYGANATSFPLGDPHMTKGGPW